MRREVNISKPESFSFIVNGSRTVQTFSSLTDITSDLNRNWTKDILSLL